MRRLIAFVLGRIGGHVPAQFRVLHRQFLLRVIDIEALSIEADIPRFLGQFAGVLLMLSFIHSFFVSLAIVKLPIVFERYLISTMMLVAGLITVVSWDAIFPDRRDIMVLAPLPIAPRMIMGAKVCASASLLGIAVLALNTAPSLVAGLMLGGLHTSIFGFFQVLAAYWVTMTAATLFPYCAVLTVQGFSALLLPRKLFLRLSALLQLGAFGLFVSVYFLEPSFGTIPELMSRANHALLASLPQYWFLGMFNQINGTLPPELQWLAGRAWMALGIVVASAAVSLLMCYLRTMKKTVEAPDLVPGGGLHWSFFGRGRRGGLRTAVAAFSFRSLLRSRQHRVALAFFLALVFAIGLTCLRREIFAPAPEAIPGDFLISTLTMMSLSVLGLRAVFALPISLNANWVLRTTQLRPTAKYIAATRTTLLVFSVVPMLMATALLALNYRPRLQVAGHLAILALFGLLFVELALVKFDKVPFTCSYLPGKANVQVIFWGAVFVWVFLGALASTFEMSALHHGLKFAEMAAVLAGMIATVGAYNRMHARSAVLYFEEVQPEFVTKLGLMYIPPERTSELSVR
jgi:hypothetical protein